MFPLNKPKQETDDLHIKNPGITGRFESIQ